MHAMLPSAWTLVLLATALPAQIDSQPTSRPAHEDAVRAIAEQFLDSAAFRIQHPREPRSDFAVTAVTAIAHPRLEALLPGHRCCFAHVRQRQERRDYITLYFALVDTRTGKARLVDRGEALGNEAWRFDPLGFLKEQDVRATDRDRVAACHELYRVLLRVAGGGGEPVAKGAVRVPDEVLARKFGLGAPEPRRPQVEEPTPRIVESETGWFAVVASQRSEDWDMQVAASFRWLAFRKKDGKLLGLDHAKGKVWPHAEFTADAFRTEVERFCAELARR